MEIASLPGPDRTISDEDIRNRHMISRRYRNRRIGDFLKELKLIEGRNTGIPTILRAMQQNGSKPPVFETDIERTYFTVILAVQDKFLPASSQKPERRVRKRRNISEIKDLILATLSQRSPLSSSELAEAMGYTKVTDTVGKAIRELIGEHKIEYIDSENLRSRYQKLRLTKN